MRDENCLRRQWALLRALASRHAGLTIRQMADDLGVTVRTIRRDLDVFRGVGFPLEELVGEFGVKTWKIRGARDLPQLAFTFDEALALSLGPSPARPARRHPVRGGRRVTPSRRSGPCWDRGRWPTSKGSRPPSTRRAAGPATMPRSPRSIDALRVASRTARGPDSLYRSEGDAAATGRDVRPFGLIHHRGALYLVALDPKAGKVKHYKVDRIEEVEVGPPVPAAPEDFDLAAHMASAFGGLPGRRRARRGRDPVPSRRGTLRPGVEVAREPAN